MSLSRRAGLMVCLKRNLRPPWPVIAHGVHGHKHGSDTARPLDCSELLCRSQVYLISINKMATRMTQPVQSPSYSHVRIANKAKGPGRLLLSLDSRHPLGICLDEAPVEADHPGVLDPLPRLEHSFYSLASALPRGNGTPSLNTEHRHHDRLQPRLS